eukprot:CAMPEP_0185726332 /NCGR_PEP_ID=MMETSP1171-20130828/2343_1 /TAXON_ID=374046 /ORGANISM="Helicotheca tamensis, Strain CCMP826" /LENGTH=212 /DNA_ID=CAMNT_0028394659 /DNA_START=114 /DNA_END=752 /DNA_ORIENTATION=+
MKTFTSTSVLAVALLASSTEALVNPSLSVVRSSSTVAYGYVPDGFTPESYKKFKENEKKKKTPKNLGGVGPRGFKSRSMQSFQEAMERGEASHLLPVFNAKQRIASGELKEEDIPYMQRGGSWDNSDVKGAKKKKWLQSDKEYAAGGFKKEQSVSIFGFGKGLDWTGTGERAGPEGVMAAKATFKKNYKAPNVKDIKKSGNKGNEKKFFGLF